MRYSQTSFLAWTLCSRRLCTYVHEGMRGVRRSSRVALQELPVRGCNQRWPPSCTDLSKNGETAEFSGLWACFGLAWCARGLPTFRCRIQWPILANRQPVSSTEVPRLLPLRRSHGGHSLQRVEDFYRGSCQWHLHCCFLFHKLPAKGCGMGVGRSWNGAGRHVRTGTLFEFQFSRLSGSE